MPKTAFFRVGFTGFGAYKDVNSSEADNTDGPMVLITGNRDTMKKIAMLLTLVVLTSVLGRAQQQLATLNHSDSISVYYGMDALKSALDAATNGDIITLSSGVFSSPSEITKAITLRGAGAWQVEGGGNITVLNDETTLDVPEDSLHHLTIEGINFPKNVYLENIYGASFWKCNFKVLRLSSVCYVYNTGYYNCIIQSYYNSPLYYRDNIDENTQYVNSVILGWTYSDKPASFINCIVKQDPATACMNSRTFTNCILFGGYAGNNTPDNNYQTSFNSAFINTVSYSANGLYKNTSANNLWNFIGMSTVFKTFDGTLDNGYNFELQDSIATQCLGNDGTQIGIYGGPVPFDPRVNNPMIKKINVARQSTADGKLAVDIEVVSDEHADTLDSELE